MRKYFPINEEAVRHIWICNCSILNFLIYEKNFILFFINMGQVWQPFRLKKLFLIDESQHSFFAHFFSRQFLRSRRRRRKVGSAPARSVGAWCAPATTASARTCWRGTARSWGWSRGWSFPPEVSLYLFDNPLYWNFSFLILATFFYYDIISVIIWD
jgi:hypothetical protein